MNKQKDSKLKKVMLLLSILIAISTSLGVLTSIILDPKVSTFTFESSFNSVQGITVVILVLFTLFALSKNFILDTEDSTHTLQSLLIKLEEQNKQSITTDKPNTELKQSDVEKQLINNISESKKNAERLFSRSSNCLLVGCVISILGVFAFYLLNMQASQEATDLTSRLLQILPRFGVLFFIEYIAFFFLKQYRILMEEYRYYEAIKRERQDILSVYLLIKEYDNNPEIQKTIIDYIDKHSAKVPYITGSHKIKTEKLVYDDLDLLSKVTSLVQAVKSKEKASD